MTDLPPPTENSRSRWPDALAVAIGTLMTLVVSGYQFGRGNHTVYLLDGLRLADPTLLRNDWFITSTLQYHAIFSWSTAALMKLNALEPAFIAGYVVLAITWHIAWLKFTQRLGGTRLTYLFSVVLFYISAAGISLGAYQFLQDGCFLPSNVSTIAMLWGFYLFATDRRIASGLCLGIAGLFHLNFAVVALGMWFALLLCDLLYVQTRRIGWRTVLGSALVLIPSLLNIVHALRVKLRESGSIPLDDFVNIYVRFRHTHHFSPLDWPIALWIAFLWPIPLAIHAWRARSRTAPPAEQRTLTLTARIVAIIAALDCIAVLFAGIWYVNESLVQLMLWRFSIYIKLISCIGAAYVLLSFRARGAILWIIPIALSACVFTFFSFENRSHPIWLDIASRAIREHRAAFLIFTALTFVPALMHSARYIPRTPAAYLGGVLACVIVVVIGWNRWLGFGMTPEQIDPEYLKLCHWAREATPIDAIFLVPPSDTAFRLEAQRAIVVNFKHVPQLSGEIVHWVDRMQDVLGVPDLKSFPRRDYTKLFVELDARYESRSPADLIDVANKYAARYIVVDHDLGLAYRASRAFRSPTGRYFVYDLHE